MKTLADRRREKELTATTLTRQYGGDLSRLSDDELVVFAETVKGQDLLPNLGTVPEAFNRLAAMIRELQE